MYPVSYVVHDVNFLVGPLIVYFAHFSHRMFDYYLARKAEEKGEGDVGCSARKLMELCTTGKMCELRNEENSTAFCAFVTIVLPPVVGRVLYRNRYCIKKVSTFVTIPDEAFGILLLEHNYNKWEEMVRTSTKDDGAKKVKTTWASTSAKGKQVSGWIDSAASRFHEIVTEVQSNRGLVGMDDREEDMLKNFSIAAGGAKNKKKRRFEQVQGGDATDTPSAPNYLITMGQNTMEEI